MSLQPCDIPRPVTRKRGGTWHQRNQQLIFRQFHRLKNELWYRQASEALRFVFQSALGGETCAKPRSSRQHPPSSPTLWTPQTADWVPWADRHVAETAPAVASHVGWVHHLRAACHPAESSAGAPLLLLGQLWLAPSLTGAEHFPELDCSPHKHDAPAADNST